MKQELAAASQSVKVSMFLFSPNWHDRDINLLRDFQDVPRRGCQARIILSAHPLKVGKRRPNVETAQKLVDAGWEVRIIAGRRTLHEKIIIVDDTAAIVGSHNIAYASATSNYDTSLLLEGPEIVEQLTRQFWQRWQIAKAPSPTTWELRAPIKLGFTP